MRCLGLGPDTIDISVLRELHEPNFISRYPPLHKRLPRVISISSFNNQCEYQKQNETLYESDIVFDTDFKSSSSFIHRPLHILRKRSRLMLFFKKFVKKREKHQKILTRNTIVHSIISSPILLPFTDPLFPQQSTISIREDSESEIFNMKSKSQRLNTSFLITSSLINPPINPEFSGVQNHSSELIHPSVSWPSQVLSILGIASIERDISRLTELPVSGERSGQHTGLSDGAHVEGSERISRILHHDHFRSPQEQTDYQFCTQTESDKDSYYSFTKSPAIGADLRDPAYFATK